MSDLASANGRSGSPWLAARLGEKGVYSSVFHSVVLITRVSFPQTDAAALVANDPRFKKYSQQVEKCLTSFDNVHEWADFITFLTKLLKVGPR